MFYLILVLRTYKQMIVVIERGFGRAFSVGFDMFGNVL